MAKLRGLLAALTLSLACDAPNGLAPSPAASARTDWTADQDRDGPPAAAASGGGHYSLAGLDVQFGFTAVSLSDGRTTGRFHVNADEGGGLLIDFSADVTCLAVDPVNHRAWIGGVITRTPRPPTFSPRSSSRGTTSGSACSRGTAPTTTFTGRGSGGIPTSAAYCAARIWPADNARTWPVVSGNINVRP
jgi:hypothetical protein